MANFWEIKPLDPNVITADVHVPNCDLATDMYVRLIGRRKKNLPEMCHLMHMDGGTDRVHILAPTAAGGEGGKKKKHCTV